MCVRGLDVHRLKNLNEVQSGGTKQKEKESRKRQRVTGRKKEREREEKRRKKRDGGSKKLTLSFPETLAYSFKNSNDSHGESTKHRPKRRLHTQMTLIQYIYVL